MNTLRHRSGRAAAASQRGATLIVALIVLVLITLLVVNAYTISSSNLKAVGNMQSRDETMAAANQALEKVVSSPFYNALGEQNWNVDINKDGTVDFVIKTYTPECIRATKASAAYPSDVELGVAMSSGANWNVDWDIKAEVTDAASGASTIVHQGVRKYLSQTQKETACPGVA